MIKTAQLGHRALAVILNLVLVCRAVPLHEDFWQLAGSKVRFLVVNWMKRNSSFMAIPTKNTVDP